MADGTISKTIHISAPREMVWEYLTSASEMAKWFHKPDADFTDGQPFTMHGQDGSALCSGFPASAEAFGLLVAIDKGWDGHLLRMREIESH